MERIEASPPREMLVGAGSVAVVAAWHAMSTLGLTAGGVPTWRKVVAAALIVFALVAVAWIAHARRFVLTSDALNVGRLVWPSSVHTYARKNLTAVGVRGTRVWGNTVIEVSFGESAHFSVPHYYSNSSDLFRALFSQLGANVEAKNAA